MRLIEDEGGVRGKGPSDVAFRWEARMRFGCCAAVRKKGDAGGSPATHHAEEHVREASKGKLGAGSDRRMEERTSRRKAVKTEKKNGSKERTGQVNKKGWEFREEGKNNGEGRLMCWNENNSIKLTHFEDEGRREGEREGKVVDWVMKRGRKTL